MTKERKRIFEVFFSILAIIVVISLMVNSGLRAQLTVKTTSGIKLDEIIIFGILEDKTLEDVLSEENFRIISFSKANEETKLYAKAQDEKKDGDEAGYIIYMELSKEHTKKKIEIYANENCIQFVFERYLFFELLKNTPQFKDSSNEEIKTKFDKFDITEEIIRIIKENNQNA